MSPTPVARRGRGLQPAAARTPAPTMPPTSAPNMKRSAIGHANQQRQRQAADPGPGARQPRQAGFRRATRRRRRTSSARASTTITIWASWRSYIDWTPFFQTWELAGPYPRHPRPTTRSARRRRDLFADAQAMLKKIIDEKWLTGQRRDRLLARQPSPDDRRHPRLWRQGAEIPHRRPAHAAPADGARSRAAPIWRWPTSSRRWASRIISAALW